jgi:hypothetical protein
MKQMLWAVPVALLCLALLAGRKDIRRFKELRRMSRPAG